MHAPITHAKFQLVQCNSSKNSVATSSRNAVSKKICSKIQWLQNYLELCYILEYHYKIISIFPEDRTSDISNKENQRFHSSHLILQHTEFFMSIPRLMDVSANMLAARLAHVFTKRT